MAAFDMATSSFLITILPETVATRITEASLPPRRTVATTAKPFKNGDR